MEYHSQWDTFVFDRVLYRDRYISVTPSELIVRARFPLFHSVHVPLEDINRIRVEFGSLNLRGSYSLRALLHAAGKQDSRSKLVLHVCGKAERQLKVRTENSKEAYRAIRQGIHTDYSGTVPSIAPKTGLKFNPRVMRSATVPVRPVEPVAFSASVGHASHSFSEN